MSYDQWKTTEREPYSEAPEMDSMRDYLEHREQTLEAEIERLRAVLQRIADYPSLVPSEMHYAQFPSTERFPDFREIARDALKQK